MEQYVIIMNENPKPDDVYRRYFTGYVNSKAGVGSWEDTTDDLTKAKKYLTKEDAQATVDYFSMGKSTKIVKLSTERMRHIAKINTEIRNLEREYESKMNKLTLRYEIKRRKLIDKLYK